jgi:Mg2+/Co2+ transporter CorC
MLWFVRKLIEAGDLHKPNLRSGICRRDLVMAITGLLSHVSGKVPVPGGKVDLEGYRFEVLEANQRKVLRLRARHLPAAAQTAPR